MNHHSFGHAIDTEPWPDVPLQQCESCERRDETVRRRLNRKGAPRLCGRCFVAGRNTRGAAVVLALAALAIFAFSMGERHMGPQVVVHRTTEALTGDQMNAPDVFGETPGVEVPC